MAGTEGPARDRTPVREISKGSQRPNPAPRPRARGARPSGPVGLLVAVLAVPSAWGEPPQAPVSALGAVSNAAQDLARRVRPCVVKVVAIGYLAVGDGDQGTVSRGQSWGSGVIIDPDGYIVTNAHVVGGADHVQVTFPVAPPNAGDPGQDGWSPRVHRVLPAQVVGEDEEADVALLKVAETGLPHLPLAHQGPIRQGELVLAFGSPQGLEDSVSLGVVSSAARQLEPDDPIAYVQTDAPVNPGSSGGPLVDAVGQLVGINTLFLSQSGGSEGLGFAIPVDLVKVVVDQLHRAGHASRADIGLDVRTVNQTLAAAWGLPAVGGVVVEEVVPEGPADNTQIRPGDLIESVDAEPLANLLDLNLRLYRAAPGSELTLGILRDGQRFHVPVKTTAHRSATSRLAAAVRQRDLIPQLGAFVVDMDQDLARELDQSRGKRGVLIAAVLGEAPALGEDLQAGDIIYRMNRQPVTNSTRLRELFRTMKPGDPIALQLEREGRLRFVASEIP